MSLACQWSSKKLENFGLLYFLENVITAHEVLLQVGDEPLSEVLDSLTTLCILSVSVSLPKNASGSSEAVNRELNLSPSLVYPTFSLSHLLAINNC